MPKIIGGETYYTVPEAARRVGVSRVTLFRWVTDRKVSAMRDAFSGHYYLDEGSLKRLLGRFESVEMQIEREQES